MFSGSIFRSYNNRKDATSDDEDDDEEADFILGDVSISSAPSRSKSLSLELEMDSLLIDTSTQSDGVVTPRRTQSGSVLRRRDSSPLSIHKSTVIAACEGRGRRIARAAYSRGKRAARRVFRIPHSRISILLLCLLAMIFLSIFLDAFEGTMIMSIFDTAQYKDKKSYKTLPTINVIDNNNNGNIILQTSSPTVSPTEKIIPIVNEISVYDAQNISSQYNTFTTWLDFDEHDPPKRTKYPKPLSGDAFVEQWCDLTGTKWYPDKDDKKTKWQLRAPKFILPGAAYSGTVYMAAALHTHPQILPARTKELQFFHERPFKRYVSTTEQTLVRAARDRMYARDYDKNTLLKNNNYIQFDASPGYLFYSSLLPRRILCVEPWIKLIIILRNPVDRILEHYNAAITQRGLKVSLEQWIEREFILMEKVGLIPPRNDTNAAETEQWKTFQDSKEEDLAWYEYQTSSKQEGVIGRSMYVIQIRQWIQAFRTAGKNPIKDILIVRTDHIAINPQKEYDRIIEFIKLDQHIIPTNMHEQPPKTITHQTHYISNNTRKLLEDFYRPYNRRLKRIIRQYGILTEATVT